MEMEAENNFPPDFLSQSHLEFMIDWMEFEERQSAAIINDFLSRKERD